ncbi:hypothetical protein CP8484711_0893, partial [Chlamydia psittaci 84-8471/1]
MRERK